MILRRRPGTPAPRIAGRHPRGQHRPGTAGSIEGLIAMKHSATSQLDWTVEALIDAHPTMLPVLMRHGMACVGCPMAPFETLAEAAREYRVDPAAILREMKALHASGHRSRRAARSVAPFGA